MKFILSSLGLVVFYLFLSPAFAQTQWAARAGGAEVDAGWGIAIDGAGNSIVTGAFTGISDFGPIMLTSAGDGDIFIAKYDSKGELLWARRAGDTDGDVGRGIAVDDADNVIVTGAFFGRATFGPITLMSPNALNMFIVKYDASGNMLWAKQSGGVASNNCYGNAVACDGSGNSVVTGFFNGTVTIGSTTLRAAGGMGDLDVFIAKYSSSGNLLWAKRAGGTAGGTFSDEGKGIAIDGSGNIFVTGHFNSKITFDTTTLIGSGSLDIFVAKYDANGNVLWAKKSGGTDVDKGLGIAVDGAGNAFVMGSFVGTALFDNVTLTNGPHFIAKYNNAGNLLWVKSATG